MDIAIKAFKQIAEKIPEANFHIYGEGSEKTNLIQLTTRLNLEDRIIFF